MNNSPSVRSSLYWVVFSSVPTQIICFIISIFVARILAPEDFGILAVAMMIIGYANLFSNIGLNESIVQKRILNKTIINSIFSVDITISIILALAVVLSAEKIAVFFNAPESAGVLMLASSVFLISTFQGVSEAILRRDMRFKAISIINSLQVITVSVLTLVLASLGFEYWALIIGQVLPLLIFTIIICVIAKWIPKLSYTHEGMRDSYNFGIWNFIKAQLQFIISHFDKGVIGRVLGPAALGIYDKSMSISYVPLTSVGMKLNAVMFSSFSNNKDELSILKNSFRKGIVLTSLINSPIYIGLALISPYFVELLLGEKWLEMITPFQILLIASLIKSYAGMSSSFNIGVGNYKYNTIRIFYSGISLIVCCIVLVDYGVIGVAIAFAIYSLIETVLIAGLALNRLDMKYIDLLKMLGSGTFGAILFYVCVKYIYIPVWSDINIINMIFIMFLSSIIYGLYILVFGSAEAKEIVTGLFLDLRKVK